MTAIDAHAERAALITRAKSLAAPVASCVAASLRPDHLLTSCTWEELAALVIVLADAADPTRLRAVVEADDGKPSPGPGELRLRRAHAEYVALRKTLPADEIPRYLARLEAGYQQMSAALRRQARQRDERQAVA